MLVIVGYVIAVSTYQLTIITAPSVENQFRFMTTAIDKKIGSESSFETSH